MSSVENYLSVDGKTYNSNQNCHICENPLTVGYRKRRIEEPTFRGVCMNCGAPYKISYNAGIIHSIEKYDLKDNYEIVFETYYNETEKPAAMFMYAPLCEETAKEFRLWWENDFRDWWEENKDSEFPVNGIGL